MPERFTLWSEIAFVDEFLEELAVLGLLEVTELGCEGVGEQDCGGLERLVLAGLEEVFWVGAVEEIAEKFVLLEELVDHCVGFYCYFPVL